MEWRGTPEKQFRAPGGCFPLPTRAGAVFGGLPSHVPLFPRGSTFTESPPCLGQLQVQSRAGIPSTGLQGRRQRAHATLGVPEHPAGSCTWASASGRTRHGDWMDHSELKNNRKRCLFQKHMGNHKCQVKLSVCSGQL